MATEPTAAGPGRLSLIYTPASYVQRLDWSLLFPQPHPVEIELGSGDGSFLVEWARRHPNRNFLGVERLKGRLRKLDRKGARAGLINLRGLRLEAAYFMRYLVPPASIHAVHVYFPDPWPKRKHQRHRLISPEFAEHTARALVIGGTLFLRTDDASYFALMNEVLAADPRFTPTQIPADLAAVGTDFEQEFNARGTPTLRAAFRRA